MVYSKKNNHAQVKTWNWGIVAPGHIAQKFSIGLAQNFQAKRYAVASRELQKAKEFAKEFGFAKAYGSYEELFHDPEVDIIYVASPNHMHFEHTIEALQAGKHVLCEKPFALNSHEVTIMSALAHRKNLFLMEALWTRFIPSYLKTVEWIKSGVIGEPKQLTANFGFVAQYDPQSRLFNPEFGGGSLADIGIYPAFLALTLFGYPEQISATSTMAPSGVDMSTEAICRHKGGVLSKLICTFAEDLETEALITGTKGSLRMHRSFHMPCALTLARESGEVETIPADPHENGYQYEAIEVMRCLNNGQKESDQWPLSKSAELLRFLEAIKASALEHAANART